MPLLPFALVLALLVLANVAYPIWQAIATGGVIYYTNASDETSYLQYDFARAMAGLARPGSFIAVKLHELGLSGGWQNLLFDLFTPIALALGLVWTFRRAGLEAGQARLASLGMLVLPLIVGATNPLMNSLSFRAMKWGAFCWLNMVIQHSVAVVRTPEPQVSLLLLVAATALAVRFRSALPVIAALPCMYTFLALPVTYVAGAWQLRHWWGDRPYRTAGPLILPWVGMALACGVFLQLKQGGIMHIFTLHDHVPWVSLSSAMALALYVFLRPAIPEGWRFLSLAAALAPLAATNQHVLSGLTVSPVDFEDYGGVFAIALVAVAGREGWPRLYKAAIAFGCVIWFWVAGVELRNNLRVNAMLPFDQALATALREDSRHVAIGDRDVAGVMALVYPRQPTTALGFEQGSPWIAPRYVDEYRCIRERVVREQAADPRFYTTLLYIDDLYTRANQTFYVLTMQRPRPVEPLYDVYHGCDPRFDHPLRYFHVHAPPP